MQKYCFKIFLLASFFIIGTTLFSCADKNENKNQNNEIEAVDTEKDEINNLEQIPDTSQLSKEDSLKLPEKNIEINKEVVIPSKTTSHKNNPNHSVALPANESLAKSVKIKENKNLQPEKINNDKNSSAKVKTKAIPATETPSQINAEFPGGIEQFHNFFMKEYKKPESASYWKININLAFAVEKNGTLSFLECSPAVEELVEKEIIRVLNLCPKWKPGEFNGKKIKLQYSVPLFLK
ncbi:hypothetical protein [Flavobacterium hibisci]|uniref:hypothetical protein n=1 Tax=Flavobacterium hibisci TaxID=1914462 RepID=UPI001CBDB330|nr:hypothetical protein [Flavobacterium hibisci]MBZ4041693.1 hypothetical protein [Flavobacterium hibisci]